VTWPRKRPRLRGCSCCATSPTGAACAAGWSTVAKHEAYAILRRRGRAQHTLELDAQPARAGAGPLERLERRELLRLVERLSARQRLALGVHARLLLPRDLRCHRPELHLGLNRHINEGRARLRELTADDDR
jgi:hypothetical protein